MKILWTIILLLLGQIVFGQVRETVLVLPGKGIVLNSDTILLGDCSFTDMAKKLNHGNIPPLCKNNLIECFMDDGSVLPLMKRILKYDSISFIYYSCGDSVNMELNQIIIKKSEKLLTFWTKDIFIGGPDSLIVKNFKIESNDEINNTAMTKIFEYRSKGISIFAGFGEIIDMTIMWKKE